MLLKNDNKRFIRTLSGNCLKANKIRNVIALLAIVLTAVLFMTVATVVQGVQVSTKEQAVRQSGTRAMASVKYLTTEETEQILSDPAWKEAGAERSLWSVGNPELINLNVNMAWMDETHASLNYIDLTEGHMPQEEYEAALDTEVLRLLGAEPRLGTKISIQYITDSGVKTAEFTLCGIWEGEKYEQRSTILVSEPFLKNRIDESTIKHDATVPGSWSVRGTFDSDNDIEGELNAVIERAGFNPDAERGEADFVIHNVNPAYETNSSIPGEMIAGGIAGVALILFAGYLIIYNIFRISILKDIRLYGQLKTIGASPKQIRYIVKRQGYVLSAIGIPFGLIFGWLLGNALLPLIMATTSAGASVFVVPHVLLWIGAALFAFLTVSLSCSRPGRMAGRVSPVEALRYQESDSGKQTSKKGGSSRHRIFRMACANLTRSKGRTALVVMSISLSILLLNSILNATGCFDEETYVRREAVTDFTVQSAAYENYSVDDYTKTLNPVLVRQLAALEHTEDFGQVYVHLVPQEEYPFTNLGYQIGISEINGEKTTMPDELTEDSIDASILDFDWRCTAYGWDENMMNNMTLVEGELNYEKLNSGNYVIMAGTLRDDGEYFTEAQDYHAGDRIKTIINGEEHEYEVLAVAGIPSGFSTSSSWGAYENVVFSEPQFHALFPEDTDPLVCAFNAEKGAFDSLNEEVTAMASQLSGRVLTRLSAEQDFLEIQGTYTAVGIVLSFIFAVIGILNLTNVLLTGAIARQNEFAVMRSIGMSRRQLCKLFVYEGILYALSAGILSIALSALLSLTAVKGFLSGWWFAKYHLILTPAVLAALACIALAAFIAYAVDRVWNKGSIVEKLRRVE